MGHIPTQVLKDATPLISQGAPAMVANTVKNVVNKLRGNKGMSIAGNVVLITGGSNGIGRLMALECARRGAEAVVIWGYTQANIDETCADLTAMNCRNLGMQVDVSDQDQVRQGADKVLSELGRVDILINNAGVVSGARILDLTDSQIDRTLGINTRALFSVTRAFLPGMIERDYGSIVTVASAAGTVGLAKMTDYSASKWAARGFMESLRNELNHPGKRNINTLTVCPFYIDTGMFDGVKTRVPWMLPILQPEYVSDRIIESIVAGDAELFLPGIIRYVSAARIIPMRWFDYGAGLLGINDTMADFKGRS